MPANANRRSSSKIKPRIFLLLQIVAMSLVTYIAYTILAATSLSPLLIVAILGIINIYTFTNIFFKCKLILKRANFSRKFSSLQY